MKARMTVNDLTITNSSIKATGGPRDGQIGHEFIMQFRAIVTPRTRGPLSGEGIDCPELEWNETIEWFRYNEHTRDYYFVGQNAQNMYRANPASHTFNSWHQYRYRLAAHASNGPPPGLAATNTENAAKHWISHHGFQWTIQIQDVPAIALAAGGGGGGGASLVVSSSRRRVIYFDLGFSGGGQRVRCVQILETLNGAPTIHKFINQALPPAQVNNPLNLARWRNQLVHAPHAPNWNP